MGPAEILRGFAIAVLLTVPVGCVVESNTIANVYERCKDPEDCPSTAPCVFVFTDTGRRGQMCTAPCTSDAECPLGGACLLGVDPVEPEFDGGTAPMLPNENGCFMRCNDDFDCGFGFACSADAISGTTSGRLCVPD